MSQTDDPELSAYVDRVGQRVVASSDMAGLPFRFTVLNSPIVNAFTVGGAETRTRAVLTMPPLVYLAALALSSGDVLERTLADPAALVASGVVKAKSPKAVLVDFVKNGSL